MAAAESEFADHVAAILQRAHPKELRGDELVEQAGITTDEMREAIKTLEARGELAPDSDDYLWRDPSVGLDDVPDEPGVVEEPEGDVGGGTAASVPEPGGATNRFVLEVSGSFPPARGQSDEGAVHQAETIATEIQNVLGSALPAVGCLVSIKRLEVYDRPRILFDAEQEVRGEQ